jgi:hypothetical protein
MNTITSIILKIKTWTEENPIKFIFILGFLSGFIIKSIF